MFFLGILFWKNNQGILYPIIFISKKYNLIEYNYKIYNKELFVIIYCFCWYSTGIPWNLYHVTRLR
jgi:hypothetical protein